MDIGVDVLYYGNRDIPPIPAKIVAKLEDGMYSLVGFSAGDPPVVSIPSAAACTDDLDDRDFGYNFFTSIGRELTPKPMEEMVAKESADAILARIEELKKLLPKGMQ
jgi:hypothetical protein